MLPPVVTVGNNAKQSEEKKLGTWLCPMHNNKECNEIAFSTFEFTWSFMFPWRNIWCGGTSFRPRKNTKLNEAQCCSWNLVTNKYKQHNKEETGYGDYLHTWTPARKVLRGKDPKQITRGTHSGSLCRGW